MDIDHKVMDVEMGIQKLVTEILALEQKPILVSFYGIPNSGKTYIIDKVWEILSSNAVRVARFGGSTDVTLFNRIKSGIDISDVYLFHCAWLRQPIIFDHEDPNILALGVLKYSVHFNIGVFNPKLSEEPKGEYYFIISNPDSIVK